MEIIYFLQNRNPFAHSRQIMQRLNYHNLQFNLSIFNKNMYKIRNPNKSNSCFYPGFLDFLVINLVNERVVFLSNRGFLRPLDISQLPPHHLNLQSPIFRVLHLTTLHLISTTIQQLILPVSNGGNAISRNPSGNQILFSRSGALIG